MPVRHSQSLELKLKADGKLKNAIRREAFPLLEKLYERVQPALWREDEAYTTAVLSEEEQRNRAMSMNAERTRQRDMWFSRSLDFCEKDKELSLALAERAAGKRGDRELPAHMVPEKPLTEMQRLYAQFDDTMHFNPEIEPPAPYSRLQLRDPNVPERAPPSRFGEARHMTSVHPVPAAPPRPDVLSMAALSRKLLPQHLHVPDDKPAKPTGYTVGRANREGEQLQTRGSIPLPDPNRRW
jgi:hypothetical protein